MKKNYLFLIAAAFAALAISCSKEIEGPASQEPVASDPEEITGEYTHFTAVADASKSAFGDQTTDPDGYKVIWNTWKDGKKDIVDTVVVNGKKAFDIEIKDEGRALDFKVADVTDPYFAVVAPITAEPDADGIYGKFDAEAKTMLVLVRGPGGPQKYVEGTYDPRSIIMAAYSAEEPVLDFKHYSTFLQLTVDPESRDQENVRWVYIHDGEGGYLAGTWKFDFSNPDNITLTPNGMTKPIAYDCGKDGIPAGTPMTIVLPAYNYTKGLIITIKDVKGHFSSYKVNNADYSEMAGVIMKKTVKLEPKPGVINSAEDWEEFVAFAKSSKYKNDYDIYKWVGDGSVRIGQNFKFTKEQTRFTGMDGMGLQYDLDGGGYTITFDCDTQFGLFRGLRATVKNLNIAATEGHKITGYSGGASAFADTLYPGGEIINCTNSMPIDLSGKNIPLDAGAFVKYNAGGKLEGCVNNAAIKVTNTCTTAPDATKASIRVGGIAATMGTAVYSAKNQLCGACDMEMKDCTNNGTIEVTPVVEEDGTHNNGYVVFAVGGVVGWLRGHASFGGEDHEYMKTLDNCDNTGAINVYGKKITSSQGLATCAVCVGGIAGTVAPLQISGAGTGALNSPKPANGLLSKFIGCDNSGDIYNCVTDYFDPNVAPKPNSSNNKVYTAGLVGALLGTEAKYAVVDNCTNTGAVVPYDLVTGDVPSPSVTAAYCSVVSGLIGFCGYVDIKNSTVCCKVGTTKRPVVAIGGITAWAMRPLKINNCKSYIEGGFTRVSGFTGNRAILVNVPMKYGSTTSMSPDPSMAGSEITGCMADWINTTSTNTMSAGNTDDQTSGLQVKMKYDVNNLVNGQKYETKTDDWGTIGCSQWTGHPAVGTLPVAN